MLTRLHGMPSCSARYSVQSAERGRRHRRCPPLSLLARSWNGQRCQSQQCRLLAAKGWSRSRLRLASASSTTRSALVRAPSIEVDTSNTRRLLVGGSARVDCTICIRSTRSRGSGSGRVGHWQCTQDLATEHVHVFLFPIIADTLYPQGVHSHKSGERDGLG